MKGRFLPAIVSALLLFLVFAAGARADDLKAMEGTWKVAKAEAAGKPVESEEVKAIVVKIAGDRYEVQLKDGKDYGSLKLEETKTPKTMDATKTEGFDAGQVIQAIYELKGDTLRVCYALDGSGRPTELATKEDVPWLLITYQREK